MDQVQPRVEDPGIVNGDTERCLRAVREIGRKQNLTSGLIHGRYDNLLIIAGSRLPATFPSP
jgi:hypothetical protein